MSVILYHKSIIYWVFKRDNGSYLDNIKMDFQEFGGSRGDWMEIAQDRDRRWALVGTVRDFRVSKIRGIS
jgi:hypothetical protein